MEYVLMRRRGFTLVEVTLVIAISAMLFMAFISSVGSTVNSRRYTESAHDFTEFLRSVYSTVISVESNGAGNTNQAIYGRLITFGEDSTGRAYIYDVIGDALSSDQLAVYKTLNESLKQVHATVLNRSSGKCYAYNEDYYEPLHSAWIENVSGTNFTGSVLIVRSPNSGTVSTRFYPNALPVQSRLSSCSNAKDADLFQTDADAPHPASHTTPIIDQFQAQEINFCIASDDQPNADIRRNVRIPGTASNASAVQLIPQDQGDSVCNS